MSTSAGVDAPQGRPKPPSPLFRIHSAPEGRRLGRAHAAALERAGPLHPANDRAEFAASGSYTTRADVLKLHFDELGETWGYRWSLYRGTLKLERDKSLGTPPELHPPTSLLVNPWRRIR
jgi:hypothetical protein